MRASTSLTVPQLQHLEWRSERGCMQCRVPTRSTLAASADDEEDFRTVHVGDMMTLSDPMFDIPEEFARIPLTVLAKGQYLEFYAFATYGRGRDRQARTRSCSGLPPPARGRAARQEGR